MDSARGGGRGKVMNTQPTSAAVGGRITVFDVENGRYGCSGRRALRALLPKSSSPKPSVTLHINKVVSLNPHSIIGAAASHDAPVII